MVGKDHVTLLYITTAARGVGWSKADVQAEAKWLKEDLRLHRIVSLDVAEVSGGNLEDIIGSYSKGPGKEAGIHAIYVEGGNAWYLRHHMRASGFDRILRKLCDEGAVYIGVSAGSIVAGASVQVAAWKGWNETTGLGIEIVDWCDLSNLEGLNLCDSCSVFPHYTRHWENTVDQSICSLGHDCIILSDGQGYVIDSDIAMVGGHKRAGRRFGMRLHRDSRCR